jgi:hypothetical protein
MRLRGRVIQASAILVLALTFNSASAIDHIVFEADEVSVDGVRATNVTVSLDLANPNVTTAQGSRSRNNAANRPPGQAASARALNPDDGPRNDSARSQSSRDTRGAPTATLRAARVQLGAPIGEYRDLELTCFDLVVKEPTYACRGAQVSARGGPTGAINAQAFAVYNATNSLLTFGADGISIAGGRAHVDGSLGERGWSLKADAVRLEAGALRKLAKPWIALPDAFTTSGSFGATVQASGRARQLRFNATVQSSNLGFSNEEGTIVAENVGASISASGTRSAGATSIDARFIGSAGQALGGPVLLDFGANPLDLKTRATLQGDALQIDSVAIAQKNLLSATGNARVTLGKSPSVQRARLDITQLDFPAAYTSFAQILLATTDFGTLQTSGRASGSIDIEANSPRRVDLKLDALNLNDTRGKFSMADVSGELHWTHDARTSITPSFMSWRSGSAYGLAGGATRLDFKAQGLGLELTRQAKLPIFDGAVVMRSLALRQLGQPDAEVKFDAVIEPISMPLLCKAFGWPELQGSLSGRVPGLAYRNRELTVEGDLSASVFDGTVVGRNFRLRDPLGPWPRLFADVTARQLDLGLVTRTFAIGNITGRLDVDLLGMELFNWSPVAFDAKLYTSPGDRSRHVISQKAVTSISNVGGGGGGVTAALQSGVLRFFDDFRYDRIGITCQLRNEVCVMGGIEPAGMGYYMVKGRGIPRIDIIGNQGRVDWPQLMGQIVAGMQSNNVIVR